MEASVKFLNGHNTESPSDADAADEISAQSPPSKRGTTVSAIIILGLLAIIIGAIIGVMAVHPPEEKPSFVRAAESIKAVCAVTNDPESCFAEISSVDSRPSDHVIDPEMIFDLTLKLAAHELANISSFPETLILDSTDLGSGSALRECASLFEDAVSQLSRAVESMGEGWLTEGKVADLETWISAAMTDQESCVEGLEEMGSTAVDEVRLRMQRSSVGMSNSLAILANMKAILEQFGLQLH
ncbi:hypothetical protein SSX86_008839 [Deinandra increscens subsp. villosa]|uniref:pectinesterase n=1 Tax=Deinandra increscens subsp. villosa TaxID=3103831 RepID=A0AAP0H770_9ASTR